VRLQITNGPSPLSQEIFGKIQLKNQIQEALSSQTTDIRYFGTIAAGGK